MKNLRLSFSPPLARALFSSLFTPFSSHTHKQPYQSVIFTLEAHPVPDANVDHLILLALGVKSSRPDSVWSPNSSIDATILNSLNIKASVSTANSNNNNMRAPINFTVHEDERTPSPLSPPGEQEAGLGATDTGGGGGGVVVPLFNSSQPASVNLPLQFPSADAQATPRRGQRIVFGQIDAAVLSERERDQGQRQQSSSPVRQPLQDNAARMNVPHVNPQMNVPQMNAPQMNAPHVNPQMNAPQMHAHHINTPQGHAPQTFAPQQNHAPQMHTQNNNNNGANRFNPSHAFPELATRNMQHMPMSPITTHQSPGPLQRSQHTVFGAAPALAPGMLQSPTQFSQQQQPWNNNSPVVGRRHAGPPSANNSPFGGVSLDGSVPASAYQITGAQLGHNPHFMNGRGGGVGAPPSHHHMMGPRPSVHSDPFVDSHRPATFNTNNCNPFTMPPRGGGAGAGGTYSSISSSMGSPVHNSSVNGTSTASSRAHGNYQSQSQLPQQYTNAASLAQAIRAGALESPEARLSQGRGYSRRNSELPAYHNNSRRNSELPAYYNNGGGFGRRNSDLPAHSPIRQYNTNNNQSLIPSHSAMAPDFHPDPTWATDVTHGLPMAEDVFDLIPLITPMADYTPATAGVIRISNVPYGTTKNEVTAALGRSARIVSQPRGSGYFGIHILMDRSTGKTMDVYVELFSLHEAKSCVAAFHNRCVSGRQPRIGDRHVDIELSSQEALMTALFPRAKCVQWQGNNPIIFTTAEPFNSGFTGFIKDEELHLITMHAETPQRSPFAQRCVNRTYEAMISLLHKYPWQATEFIQLRERISLVATATNQLRVLMFAINNRVQPQALSLSLLQEYLTACLSNVGFSVKQKNGIAEMAHASGFGHMLSAIPGYTPPLPDLASWWPFEVLVKKPEASHVLLSYVVNTLILATDPLAPFANSVEQWQNSALQSPPAENFAAMSAFKHFFVKYADDNGGGRNCSLKQAAEVEWRAVCEALLRVLPSSRLAEQQQGDADTGAGASEVESEGAVLALTDTDVDTENGENIDPASSSLVG
jgi:hypothetical protein